MGAATYRHEGFKLARLYRRQSYRNARIFKDKPRMDSANAMIAHRKCPPMVRRAVGAWIRAWGRGQRSPTADDWARIEESARIAGER